MRIERGRPVDAVLAAVATFVAGWPLAGLVQAQPWVYPTMAVLAVVVVVGVLARGLRAPGWAVVALQAVLAALTLVWTHAPGNLRYGLPTAGTATDVGALWTEGMVTIQTYAVPAPATPGLTFLVACGLAAVGLAVDAVGVTARSPALAGVPLLLLCALTASNTGEPLHPRYFLATALAWLLLLGRQGLGSVRAWSSGHAGSHRAVSSVDTGAAVAGGTRRYGSLARGLGGIGLGLAVVVPLGLPHLPPTTLLEGLSRAGDGTGSGGVTFTETLDLAADLADRSNAPVIRYRADERRPPPLRVTVSSRYVDGQWLPSPRDPLDITAPRPYIGAPVGLDPALPAEARTVTVLENALEAPQVAVPHPLVGGDFGEVPWGVDPFTQTAVVGGAADSYEATYLLLPPGETLPAHIGEPVATTPPPVASTQAQPDGTIFELDADGEIVAYVQPDGNRVVPRPDGGYLLTAPDGTVLRDVVPGGADPAVLAVDRPSRERVEALTEEVVGEATNAVDVARAIQDYLRGPEFTYSLTLAETGTDADGQPLDPLSNFLETKQGYCTQFATAMVMMARAEGIPARIAVGFLPGDEAEDGTRTIVAADAHAWPELFVNGLGWTRFEPTPGERSGTAPLYRTPSEAAAPIPAPDPTVGDVDPGERPTTDADAVGGAPGSGWTDALPRLGQGLLALAALAALLGVLPLAGRWRRESWRRGARTDADRVEGEWHVLVTSLADLGVPGVAGRSPRQAEAYVSEAADLDPVTAAALGRAVARVEALRYAPGGAAPGTMREDVHRVVERRRAGLSRRDRLAALLWPRSGREQLRRWAGSTRRTLLRRA
ncbi:DUF3488 and transglutaminase-like domain-containing protein [Georgenia wangjunii]|uniref:DUF3488 and transglutaminase-like domain-containing protein n=1 Tax=Georgenia wangjunii TaxID=3117730 RepID=UPI002F264A55